MPQAQPLNGDFRAGTVGGTVPTPAGCSLVGAAPTFVSDGGSGTLARFNSAAAATYFRPTFTADSDFGQLTVDFRIPSSPVGTPTSNKETFLLAGSGAILTSGLITTSRLLYSRDASASGAGGGGWTAPTLALDTMYRYQVAIIKGSSTTTGSLKAQLIRKSDGVVLASQLIDAAGNAGAVQTNGALVGLRTAAGNAILDVAMFRVSNQAFDYLGDIPAGGSGETPVSSVDGWAFIGDSTTDRSGSGAAQVKQAILNNGQGLVSAQVQVDGKTSRTINFDNGVHPTAYEQVDTYRTAGYDPGAWAFAVGGNGGASDLAQQQTWLNQLLAKVAEGPRAAYRVLLIGFARQDPANADAARFWQAIASLTPPSKITLLRYDYNSAIHNGRDETGLWQSTSPTEAHMTASGYTLRDSLITPNVTASPKVGSATSTVAVDGNAQGSSARTGDAASTVAVSGAASGIAPTLTIPAGTATSTVAVDGSAAGSRTSSGSASSSVAVDGAAAGSTSRSGAASSDVAVTGTASGSSTRTGDAASTVLVNGSAAGTADRAGSATSSVAVTSSAQGSAPIVGAQQGSATSSVAVSGAATGSTNRSGSATSSVAVTTSATGSSTRTGDAADTVVVSGAATGSTDRSGAATSLINVSGAATGSAPALGGSGGSTASTVLVSGSAAGSKQPGGLGAALVGVTGSAFGSRPVSSDASGFVLVGGSATGSAPSLGVRSGSAVSTVVITSSALGEVRGTIDLPLVLPRLRLELRLKKVTT